MSNQSHENGSDLKSKVKKWGMGLVAVALFIAVFAIAIGARNQARANADVVMKPEWKVSYVPGGPERFPDRFEDVENDDLRERIETSDYLWSTVLITNTGEGESIDTAADISTTIPVAHALVSSQTYLFELGIEEPEEDDRRTITVDVGDLEPQQSVMVFLAMNPPEVAEPYDKAVHQTWFTDFSRYLNEVRIDSDATEYVMYGNGYVPAS